MKSLHQEIKDKKRSRIAPLQPPTLAPFLAWGSSKGAGRTGPAAKIEKNRIQATSNNILYLRKA